MVQWWPAFQAFWHALSRRTRMLGVGMALCLLIAAGVFALKLAGGSPLGDADQGQPIYESKVDLAAKSPSAAKIAVEARRLYATARAVNDPVQRLARFEQLSDRLDMAAARFPDFGDIFDYDAVFRDYGESYLRAAHHTRDIELRRHYLSSAQYAAQRLSHIPSRMKLLLQVAARQQADGADQAMLATLSENYQLVLQLDEAHRDRWLDQMIRIAALGNAESRDVANAWAETLNDDARRSASLSRIARNRISGGDLAHNALKAFAGMKTMAGFDAVGDTLIQTADLLRTQGSFEAAEALALAASPEQAGRDRELAAIAGDHAIQSGRFERMLAAHAIRNPALRDQALAEVALQAVEKGSLTEADRLSERIGSAGLRAEVLTRITARLAEEKYTLAALRSGGEAARLTAREHSQASYDRLLGSLGVAFATLSETGMAEAVAARINDRAGRDGIYLELARRAVSAGKYDEMRRQVVRVTTPDAASSANRLAAQSAMERGDAAGVSRVDKRKLTPLDRMWVSAYLARAHYRTGKRADARTLARALARSATTAVDDPPRMAAAAVYALAAVDLPKEAEALLPQAMSVGNGEYEQALGELGAAWVRLNQVDRARDVPRWATRDLQYMLVMRRVAEALAGSGRVMMAAEYAAGMPDGLQRVKALRAVAEINANRLDSYGVLKGHVPPAERQQSPESTSTPIIRVAGANAFELANRDIGDRAPSIPYLGIYGPDRVAMNLPAISRTAERRVRVIPMSYNAYNTKFLSEVNLAFRDLGSQFFPAAAQRTRYPIYIHIERGVYDLPTLARDLRMMGYGSVLTQTGRQFLLRLPLLISPGATLAVTGANVDQFMLEQGMGTFIVNAGNLWINDTRVIGWESDKNAKSELTFETRTKFRPFIISWGGSVLNAAKSQFQNLGFSGGKGYGLSYSQGPSRVLQSRPASLPRPTGELIENSFSEMYFGFYSYEADRVALIGNEYRNNMIYGIDPHDYSKKLIVAFNSAYGAQKKHGIIGSRGVDDSYFIGNLAFGNHGTGMMLDRFSGTNWVYANRVWGNRQDGIAIFESPCNIVASNQISHNGGDGIKIRNSWDIGIFGNNISGSRNSLVNMYKGDPNPVTGFPLRDLKKDPYVRYVDADIIKNSFNSSGGSGITSSGFGGATFRRNIYSGNATKMLAGDLKPLRGEIMRMEDEGVTMQAGCAPPETRRACSFRSDGYLSTGSIRTISARGSSCGVALPKVQPAGLKADARQPHVALLSPAAGG